MTRMVPRGNPKHYELGGAIALTDATAQQAEPTRRQPSATLSGPRDRDNFAITTRNGEIGSSANPTDGAMPEGARAIDGASKSLLLSPGLIALRDAAERMLIRGKR